MMITLLLLFQILCLIFFEIDDDRSGSIDKYEFRNLLRRLNLHYRLVVPQSFFFNRFVICCCSCCSDSSFKKLFRAVDNNGDGSIELSDLGLIVFPELKEFDAAVFGKSDDEEPKVFDMPFAREQYNNNAEFNYGSNDVNATASPASKINAQTDNLRNVLAANDDSEGEVRAGDVVRTAASTGQWEAVPLEDADEKTDVNPFVKIV
jgi:hypothetical protein